MYTAADRVDEAEERKKLKYTGREDRLRRLGWQVEETGAVVLGAQGVPEHSSSDEDTASGPLPPPAPSSR